MSPLVFFLTTLIVLTTYESVGGKKEESDIGNRTSKASSKINNQLSRHVSSEEIDGRKSKQHSKGKGKNLKLAGRSNEESHISNRMSAASRSVDKSPNDEDESSEQEQEQEQEQGNSTTKSVVTKIPGMTIVQKFLEKFMVALKHFPTTDEVIHYFFLYLTLFLCAFYCPYNPWAIAFNA